jgi:hypothetical protein
MHGDIFLRIIRNGCRTEESNCVKSNLRGLGEKIVLRTNKWFKFLQEVNHRNSLDIQSICKISFDKYY